MVLPRLFLAAVVGACVAWLQPGPALATCTYPVPFSSGYNYVHTPGLCPPGGPCSGPTSVTDGLLGVFWALGYGDPDVGVGVDSGTWPALEGAPGSQTGWVRFAPGEPAYIAGDWSATPRVDACIASSCMAFAVSDETWGDTGWEGFFAVATRLGSPSGAGFHLEADLTLASIPSPTIVRSTRLPGGDVEVTLRVDPPVAGVWLDPACPMDVVLGYRIYVRRSPAIGPALDDLRRTSWTSASVGGPIAFGTETSILLSPHCHGWSYAFAASIVFADGFETGHVSRPRIANFSIPEWTDVDCDGVQPFTPDGSEVLDCDDHDPAVYPGAPQVCDLKNNDCSHPAWPDLEGTNEAGEDLDGDRWAGSCDNCPLVANPSQGDIDADGAGDACDLADGLILLEFAGHAAVAWQDEQGFEAWNLYRGGLDVLRATGVYTQAPGSNLLAGRECSLAAPATSDSLVPAAGGVAFYLVTGESGGLESGLGTNGAGQERPHSNPCP